MKNILAWIGTVVLGIAAGCWLATAVAIDAEIEKRRTQGHQTHSAQWSSRHH